MTIRTLNFGVSDSLMQHWPPRGQQDWVGEIATDISRQREACSAFRDGHGKVTCGTLPDRSRLTGTDPALIHGGNFLPFIYPIPDLSRPVGTWALPTRSAIWVKAAVDGRSAVIAELWKAPSTLPALSPPGHLK